LRKQAEARPTGAEIDESFFDVLRRKGMLAETEVLKSAVQVCALLEGMHSQDPPRIHGGIRPETVFLTTAGAVRLADPPGPDGPRTSTKGRSGYTPREQREGRMEPRSDIFSLAATMHHLLSGIEPSTASFPPLQEIRKDISLETQAALNKALKDRPEERFRNVTAFKEALMGILNPEGAAPTCSVRGKVTCGKTGTAVFDALVSMGNYSARTDADGAFQLRRVPPGEGKIEISHSGYSAFAAELSLHEDSGEVAFDAKLEPSGKTMDTPPPSRRVRMTVKALVSFVVGAAIFLIFLAAGFQKLGKESVPSIPYDYVHKEQRPQHGTGSPGGLTDPTQLRLAIDDMSACQTNIGKLCTALRRFNESRRRFPGALRDLVAAKIIRKIPRCPAAKKDTYSASYRHIERPVSGFSFCCQGAHHVHAGLKENQPSVKFP
jgi:hypothetical protein